MHEFKLKPNERKIIFLASLGGALEFYDFVIYLIFAPIISQIFFPETDKIASLMSVYAVFAIGYLIRPLGGIIFSHLYGIGDSIMKFVVKVFILISFSLLLSMANAARPFIIDTDVGTDDELAILYLLAQKDIDIKAITVVGTGESHCPAGLKNVAGLLALMHQEKIPLACGRATPLSGQHHFPDWLRKQADNLAGAADLLPKVEVKTSQTAIQLLESTLLHSKEPVEILAIGPLTNLGALMVKAPELKNKIKMIYIMGGAVESPGNLVEVDHTYPVTIAG